MIGFLRRVLATPAGARRCAGCRHFVLDRDAIERAIPGLSSLSSARASVMADDGLCRLHDRLASARGGCADFTSRT